MFPETRLCKLKELISINKPKVTRGLTCFMTTAPYTMHKETICIDYIREIGRKQCLRRKPGTSEKNITK